MFSVNKSQDSFSKQKIYTANKDLEDFEVEQAKAEIAEMYPLYRTDFDTSFQFVGCICSGLSRVFQRIKKCCNCKRKDRRKKDINDSIQEKLAKVISGDKKAPASGLSLSNQLRMQRKEKENADLTQEDGKDPYTKLGFGLIAYKKLLETLILCFVIFSCIMFPAL